ncbi:polyvinylalcohol dehydrogenase [Sulfurimicrobium lacus]|uniref:Polyvinylalcohol dehydrogenase n=1 Tax=Sulfurimicrobium lacus TaxID=2715678 RepID=A0A6F8V920_9PROT|nr:STAS domain-containing protein [Sulfurimicrobium lacus]BCB25269.1 polyvinylalcohol dehydrogenase [Sulfurimicrobium lacus]
MVKQTKNTSKILTELLKLQIGNITERIEREGQTVFGGSNLLESDEIADLCIQFLQLLVALLESRDPDDDASPQFHALEMFFNNLSKQILVRGGRIEDLVRYIQFMQHTLIDALGEDEKIKVDDARTILLYLSSLFNELILAVFQAYLSEKERTIWAQEAELRETSTPITEIWDGVLTLPIIGTLDSSRTMIVMDALLNRIASDHASAVVMDLTGVKNIDSQVSHHLIQMVRAIQLMGADAILTGIRPDIARALTSLNIDLDNVTTRATLSDGLKEAFRRMGIQVSHKAA